MRNLFTITVVFGEVKIPVLDRVMDYLEAGQQVEIDARTAKFTSLTGKLNKLSAALLVALANTAHDTAHDSNKAHD